MNLQKLFETQAKLDEHIYEKHPELRGQNNLDWKILALQVELGECANEWREFKKWSKDQEPRLFKRNECEICAGSGISTKSYPFKKCEGCGGSGNVKSNPLLEEYVDCLGFILTIGLEMDVTQEADWHSFETDVENITIQFSQVFIEIADLVDRTDYGESYWWDVFEEFYWLGKLLGFTWEQIESAYFAKNQINHERQEAGY